MRKVDPRFDKDVEESIKFLVQAAPEENGKPVIIHSIKVGLYLYESGYNKHIVIGGILHDLLEDSDISYEEIEVRFGKNIAKLVKANSFDKNIPGETLKDKKRRYKQTLKRCLKAGKQALIIKAADILDNSYYYHLAPNRRLHLWLLEKMKHFIDHSADIIKKEIAWNDLNEQYNNLKDRNNN